VIRDFRNDSRGIRVYGGRVITSDPDWKYVNVRRLLIFIEASINRGLQWVVFEPNAEPLWARVRRSITSFLTLVWRNGGLEGSKVEEDRVLPIGRRDRAAAPDQKGAAFAGPYQSGVLSAPEVRWHRLHVALGGAGNGCQGQAGDDRAGRDEARSVALGGSRGRHHPQVPCVACATWMAKQQVG
jgi:hypothetical protein